MRNYIDNFECKIIIYVLHIFIPQLQICKLIKYRFTKSKATYTYITQLLYIATVIIRYDMDYDNTNNHNLKKKVQKE